MFSKTFALTGLILAGLLGVMPARAQDNGAPQPAEAAPEAEAPVAKSAAPAPAIDMPLVDGIQADFYDSIANTDADRVLNKRDVLTPKFGFEDIFVTKKSSFPLDFQRYAPNVDRLLFETTVTDIIVDSKKEALGKVRLQVGDKEGYTQVIVYENKSQIKGKPEKGSQPLKVYRVTVTKEDLLTVLQQLKALIGNVEGLEIRIVGDKVVVDGNVLVPKEMKRVLAVVARFDEKKVVNLAELSPLTMKLLAEKMEEEIAGGKDRPRDIKVKVVNGRFFLEGIVDRLADRQAAELICKSYFPEKYELQTPVQTPKFPDLKECVTMVRIRQGQPQEPDQIIALRIDFVTITRDYLKSFNFSWSPGSSNSADVGYSTDTGKFFANFTATLRNLLPVLDTASQHGHARILKSVNLLVRDGADATGRPGQPPKAFASEVLDYNIPLKQKNADGSESTTITKITVDTSVDVYAASVAGSDKINMDIIAKQSEVKGKSADAPNILRNEVRTSIVVGNNESAALGGIITERRNVNVVRDPANADGTNFSLFELARGHSLTDDKAQFIVFVTPQKLRTPAEGTEQLKRKFRLRK